MSLPVADPAPGTLERVACAWCLPNESDLQYRQPSTRRRDWCMIGPGEHRKYGATLAVTC